MGRGCITWALHEPESNRAGEVRPKYLTTDGFGLGSGAVGRPPVGPFASRGSRLMRDKQTRRADSLSVSYSVRVKRGAAVVEIRNGAEERSPRKSHFIYRSLSLSWYSNPHTNQNLIGLNWAFSPWGWTLISTKMAKCCYFLSPFKYMLSYSDLISNVSWPGRDYF